MEIVATQCQPKTLTDLSEALATRTVSERSVTVTFDDGYANNLAHALPRLAAWSVPATVFVCTGYAGGAREFWWDELERLIIGAAEAAARPALTVSLGGQSLTCTAADPTEAVLEVWRWLHRREADEIGEGLRQVRTWAGLPAPPPPRETHRPMTVDELRAISEDGLVELGAHTRWHPALAARDPLVQREEIAGSREDLERWLGRRPASFAYPYGNPNRDYSAATVAIVRQLGFRQAVGTRARLATASSSPYALPRFFVPNWAPEQLERWLAERFSSPMIRGGRKITRRLRASR